MNCGLRSLHIHVSTLLATVTPFETSVFFPTNYPSHRLAIAAEESLTKEEKDTHTATRTNFATGILCTKSHQIIIKVNRGEIA